MLPLKKRKELLNSAIELTDKRQFKQCLTLPESTSTEKVKSLSEKLILLCDTTFRGLVVKYAFHTAPLTPKEVKLFAEKLFTNKHLNKIAVDFDLRTSARIPKEYDESESNAYIARLFLGYCAFYGSEHFLHDFIKNALLGQYLFLLENNNSPVEKMNSLYYFRFGERPEITVEQLENEQYLATLFMRGVKVVSEISNSYKYSRKKVSKSAIRVLQEREDMWNETNSNKLDEFLFSVSET